MDILLVILVSAGVISAIKGFVWFINALRDGKVTLFEVLSLIEYQFSILMNFIWMYAIYNAFYRGSIEVALASLYTTPGALAAFSALMFTASLYYLYKGKPTASFVLSSIAVLSLFYAGLATADITTILYQLLVLTIITDVVLIAAVKPELR